MDIQALPHQLSPTDILLIIIMHPCCHRNSVNCDYDHSILTDSYKTVWAPINNCYRIKMENVGGGGGKKETPRVSRGNPK